MATLAERVNSRGFDLHGKRTHWGYQDDGPVEYARKAVAILEASPTPLQQADLARKSGYKFESINAIQTWLMCLTFFDERIYEEDDARLGLVGVHRDAENAQLFDDSMTWAYSQYWSLPHETILFIASQIMLGKSCRVISEDNGINRNVVNGVRKRMRKEGLL